MQHEKIMSWAFACRLELGAYIVKATAIIICDHNYWKHTFNFLSEIFRIFPYMLATTVRKFQ